MKRHASDSSNVVFLGSKVCGSKFDLCTRRFWMFENQDEYLLNDEQVPLFSQVNHRVTESDL